MKIKISTDSTCDLPAELIAAHDIGVLPLYIIRDGEALRDGIDVTPDDLYAYTKATGKLCGTSAVTIADYLTAWNGWLEDCDAIVHVAFSSELSVSCNNARLAAEELPGKVWVVDSLNLSTGFGHLVLDAALMAEKGMDPADIAAEIERLVPKVDVSFVLNTLDYLRKGGRCTSVQALHRGHRRQDDRRQEVPRQDRGGLCPVYKGPARQPQRHRHAARVHNRLRPARRAQAETAGGRALLPAF